MYINEHEIWLVDLEPTKGIEIKKIRPCLVFRKLSKHHFIIFPLTSKVKSETIAFSLENVSFLRAPINYVNIAQIRTVDAVRFIRKFGELPKKKFLAIQNKTAEVLKLLPQGASAHNSEKL